MKLFLSNWQRSWIRTILFWKFWTYQSMIFLSRVVYCLLFYLSSSKWKCVFFPRLEYNLYMWDSFRFGFSLLREKKKNIKISKLKNSRSGSKCWHTHCVEYGMFFPILTNLSIFIRSVGHKNVITNACWIVLFRSTELGTSQTVNMYIPTGVSNFKKN